MSSNHKDDAPDSDKPAPSGTPAPDSAQQSSAPAKVDIWFDTQLMQLYGEVLDEPIPADLLDLVKKLRSST
ncbi:MAG: NepR family anti-sigma factor [Dongiaceae bacterium]